MESLETLIKRSKWVNYQSPLAMQFREPLCLWFAEFLLWGCEVFFSFSLSYFILKNAYLCALLLRIIENAHISAQAKKDNDIDAAFLTVHVFKCIIFIILWLYVEDYYFLWFYFLLWNYTLIVASGCEAWHSVSCVSYSLRWKMNGSCVAYKQRDVNVIKVGNGLYV